MNPGNSSLRTSSIWLAFGTGESALDSQKCFITSHIVGWVIIGISHNIASFNIEEIVYEYSYFMAVYRIARTIAPRCPQTARFNSLGRKTKKRLNTESSTLRKHAYSNIQKISPQKTENFQIKKKTLIFFIFLLKT